MELLLLYFFGMSIDVQDWSAQNFVQNAGLVDRGRPFGRPGVVSEKRHQATARADLEPPKGLGVGL